MALYLLHYEIKLHHAQHYAGYAGDSRVTQRIDEHARGVSGARLPTAFHRLGIGFTVSWIKKRATRADERRFKNRKNAPHYCPHCGGKQP